MNKLRQQIKESFFNPVLHFLPLIIFMVVEDYWGLKMAWTSSLFVAFALFIYIYIGYRKIFEWFKISSLIYLIFAIVTSFFPFSLFPSEFRAIGYEAILLFIFIISLLLRKTIENFIHNRNSQMMPMSNNLNETFRVIWFLGGVILIYIHAYIFTELFVVNNIDRHLSFIHNVYMLMLFFVVLYELIRVTVVRIRLLKEEWWPIVNEQGKTIGTIEHLASLNDSKKFMHPIIRVMIIDDNKIFLQKRSENDLIFPGMWDTAVSNHIRMNETIEQCVNRTFADRYSIESVKTLFLSNYINEIENEYHYAFFFVGCGLTNFACNTKHIDHAKWWTVKQIEDNLNTGIFPDSFIQEFDIIKRSGLLESGTCDCDCSLKETINAVKGVQ